MCTHIDRGMYVFVSGYTCAYGNTQVSLAYISTLLKLNMQLQKNMGTGEQEQGKFDDQLRINVHLHNPRLSQRFLDGQLCINVHLHNPGVQTISKILCRFSC